LWVADSEANIVREIDFQTEELKHWSAAICFNSAIKDGEGDDVLLQHPLGVALYDGKILNADTYNHKIKLLDARQKNRRNISRHGQIRSDGRRETGVLRACRNIGRQRQTLRRRHEQSRDSRRGFENQTSFDAQNRKLKTAGRSGNRNCTAALNSKEIKLDCERRRGKCRRIH
jgi:hypothetical protein